MKPSVFRPTSRKVDNLYAITFYSTLIFLAYYNRQIFEFTALYITCACCFLLITLSYSYSFWNKRIFFGLMLENRYCAIFTTTVHYRKSTEVMVRHNKLELITDIIMIYGNYNVIRIYDRNTGKSLEIFPDNYCTVEDFKKALEEFKKPLNK
jgi:hypothetical protein